MTTAFLLGSGSALASETNFTPATNPVPSNGQHDFDFEFGTWKTHLKRLLHPLRGSNEWAEYEGTTIVRKVWDGRANLVELEVSGKKGAIEALSLRLYEPDSNQWTLNFASSAGGQLGVPAAGGFNNGWGEFYDQESFNGKNVLVRFVISGITATSCHFEQAFSEDGGKTWEVNWIATDTRLPDAKIDADLAAPAGSDLAPTGGPHDFDFELGRWTIHLKRLADRLARSTTWVSFDGTSVTKRVWNGRSQLEEFETDTPDGKHIEGLTLRLFDPETKLWRLYWANSKDGLMAVPQIGQFKNGRGEFYAQDTWKNKSVIVRFVWTETGTNTPHFEQAFSDDGGRTWEVNWTTDQQRVTGDRRGVS